MPGKPAPLPTSKTRGPCNQGKIDKLSNKCRTTIASGARTAVRL